MIIAFILLLLLAIWAGFKFGVRRIERPAPENADGAAEMPAEIPPPETAKALPKAQEKFTGKGGKFGGGGASGDW